MTARQLLASLVGRGFLLAPQGTGIKVTPWSMLPAKDQEALRQHKAEVLALLLIEQALTVRERNDWSPDPDLAHREMAVMGSIDRAFEARDLQDLQAAVAQFARLMG